jgi:hypothetical protein
MDCLTSLVSVGILSNDTFPKELTLVIVEYVGNVDYRDIQYYIRYIINYHLADESITAVTFFVDFLNQTLTFWDIFFRDIMTYNRPLCITRPLCNECIDSVEYPNFTYHPLCNKCNIRIDKRTNDGCMYIYCTECKMGSLLAQSF